MSPIDASGGVLGGRARIVEAITRLNIGGPGRHVLDIVGGLSDRFCLTIAAGVAPAVEGELPLGGVPVERLPLVRSLTPHLDASATVRMRSLLRRRQAHIVHSHMAKAGLVARVAAASIQPRPRTVHTFHGHVLSGYFAARTERFFGQIERTLARRTDVLLTVSSEIRDQLLDFGIGTPAQYEVLPLGIDVSPFAVRRGDVGRLRRHLGLGPSTPLLGVPARLAPIKDHRTLLKAMVDLPGAHLAVLGDGELRDGLVSLAAELQIESRVHFLGWWQDMPAALADVDLVVLTSRNEGTPLSLIEAGAAGVASVATAVGGVPQVVIDGHTGVLVAPGDPVAVATAVRRLLEDTPTRLAFGRSAQDHVCEHFGLERSLRQLASIYETLAASSG